MGMGKNGVTGMIFPLSSELTDRILHHHELFARFVGADSTQLEKGDNIIFYNPSTRSLEAEGRIVSLSFEPPDKVRTFGTDFYLQRGELEQYLTSAGKGGGPLLVLMLEDVTEYMRPIRCSLDIPENGLYVTSEVFGKILEENS